MKKMEKHHYMRPHAEVVCMWNAGDLMQYLPGASHIQNGDDEEPVPITPGNPGEIGAKSWFDNDSGSQSPNLWDD